MAVALIRSSPKETIREVPLNHGYDSLKEEQLLAIEEFVTVSDEFVSLLTGLKKALIYGLLPCLLSPQRVHGTNVGCFDCEPTSLTNGRSEGKVPPTRYQCRISRRNSAWYSCLAMSERRPAPTSVLDSGEPVSRTRYFEDHHGRILPKQIDCLRCWWSTLHKEVVSICI